MLLRFAVDGEMLVVVKVISDVWEAAVVVWLAVTIDTGAESETIGNEFGAILNIYRYSEHSEVYDKKSSMIRLGFPTETATVCVV